MAKAPARASVVLPLRGLLHKTGRKLISLEHEALFGGAPTAAMNVMNGAQQPWHSQIAHITVTDAVAG